MVTRALPRDWQRHVSSPETEAEFAVLLRSVVRGAAYGEAPRLAIRAAAPGNQRPKTPDPVNPPWGFSPSKRHPSRGNGKTTG
mgnify:CR=1 FL=1